MDAVGDLAGRLFGERHQHDPLGREVLVAEEKREDLGDDGSGLAGAGARFDDDVAPLRRGGRRDAEQECLLRAVHSAPPRSVRASPWWTMAYLSVRSCRVRQEWLKIGRASCRERE